MGIGLSFGQSDKDEKSTTNRNQTMQGTTTGQTAGQTSGQSNSQASYWTPAQQQLAQGLSSYLSSSFGSPNKNQRIGVDALRQAATGQGYQDIINPAATEALYAAIQKQTMEDILPKSTQTIAKQANLGGMLRSGPALKMQLENRNQVVNDLATKLANMRYQDEQQRRQILQDREGRQMGAAQALIASDPRQQQINNIMSMLGVRGASSETSQQQGQTSQQSIESVIRSLQDYISQKGKGSSDNAGLSFGF